MPSAFWVFLHLLFLLPLTFSQSLNTSFSIFGCWPQGESDTSYVVCPCFLNVSADESCPSSTSLSGATECASLINASYILQDRRPEGDVEFALNLNNTLDLIVSLVTGNCNFDCSGERDSGCQLALQSFNYSSKSGPLHFNISQGNAVNYCVRVHLKEYAPCVLYTRQYAYHPVLRPFTLDLHRLSIVCSILMTGFMSSCTLLLVLYSLHRKCRITGLPCLTRPLPPCPA